MKNQFTVAQKQGSHIHEVEFIFTFNDDTQTIMTGKDFPIATQAEVLREVKKDLGAKFNQLVKISMALQNVLDEKIIPAWYMQASGKVYLKNGKARK